MPNRFELTLFSEDRLVQQPDLYARLELITPELEPAHPVPSRPSARSGRWSQWGHALLKYFVGSKEPQISTHYDDAGNPFYVVYDPVAHQRYTFDTEQAVRTWLDGRYYQ